MKNKYKAWILSMSSRNIAFIFVVIIFLILLLQSATSLFFAPPSDELAQIDIVFRTSLSSIFGFIMSIVSINSVKNNKNDGNVTIDKPKTIGFTTNVQENEQKSKYFAENGSEKITTTEILNTPISELPTKKIPLNYQIVVLSGVCIFCLVLMVFIRNFSRFVVPSSSTVATLSVYRDFISASIGALIGLSKQ